MSPVPDHAAGFLPTRGPCTIGVAYVDSDEGREALHAAYALARRPGATLRVLSVLKAASACTPRSSRRYAGQLGARNLEDVEGEHRLRLEQDVQRIVATLDGDVPVEIDTYVGDPADILIDVSSASTCWSADRAAAGPLKAVLLGSVSRRVAAEAALPGDRDPPRRQGAVRRLLRRAAADAPGSPSRRARTAAPAGATVTRHHHPTPGAGAPPAARRSAVTGRRPEDGRRGGAPWPRWPRAPPRATATASTHRGRLVPRQRPAELVGRGLSAAPYRAAERRGAPRQFALDAPQMLMPASTACLSISGQLVGGEVEVARARRALSSSCSTLLAPISAEVTRGSRRTHAIAICASVWPRPAAISLSARTRRQVLLGEEALVQEAALAARASPRGRRRGSGRSACPGRAARTRCSRRPPRPSTSSRSVLDPAVEHASSDGWWMSSGVPSSRRIRTASRGALGRVGGDAGVERLALAHRGVERAHRLLERRLGVEAVGVEDVDVVEAHPREALVEAGQQVLARAPLAVRAGPHVVARLGGDDQLVAVGREVARAGCGRSSRSAAPYGGP